jgi:hypothetical protein
VSSAGSTGRASSPTASSTRSRPGPPTTPPPPSASAPSSAATAPPAGGGSGDADPERARALALSRFNTARAALYVGAGLEAGSVTEAVACRNASIAGVVVSVMGKSKGGRSSAEALDMLKGGADALERHYRGRETR